VSEQLHAALALAALGYAAFPCRDEPDDKRPLTPNGFKDATTDEVVIRAAWHKRANAGVGIRTGKLTDGRYLVVLDVDGDKGSDSLAELEREYGELPATVSATTWRGQHYYFHCHHRTIPSPRPHGFGNGWRGCHQPVRSGGHCAGHQAAGCGRAVQEPTSTNAWPVTSNFRDTAPMGDGGRSRTLTAPPDTDTRAPARDQPGSDSSTPSRASTPLARASAPASAAVPASTAE